MGSSFSDMELKLLNSNKGLVNLLGRHNTSIAKTIKYVKYESELKKLQSEMIKLQNWVFDNKKKVIIIFEGRDAAGKGGAIRRAVEHLNPRRLKVVALPRPTKTQSSQWYFQRYVENLPKEGNMIFFDRSWYNRAGVERVFQFCTHEEYLRFMRQCPRFEEMIVDDGIKFFKYWLDISKEEQLRRLKSRQTDPLKMWKLSPLDMESHKHYDDYQKAKEDMFLATHTAYAPWIVVDANDKKRARLNIIRDILSQIEYEGKDEEIVADSEIISIYHRK